MDTRWEARLTVVEPDLCKVIGGAAQTARPFEVTYGVLTVAAVDVTPLIDGELSFAAGEEGRVHGQPATQINASAEALGVTIEWGGDWVSFKDWGHLQLPWGPYP